jgi:hypothetical protein
MQEQREGEGPFVSMGGLTVGLLEAGAYEGALGLMQQAVGLARTLPLTLQVFLLPLSSVYHALQQWQEARAALEEIEAIAERLNLGLTSLLPILTRLCLHWAVPGEWEAASRYAKGETS